MGLKRIILERQRGSIAIETSTFNGRKTFVLRRGWMKDDEWKYTKEGINFNKASFSWLIENLSSNLKDIVDFFEHSEEEQLSLPETSTKALTGTTYNVLHDNVEVKVEIDTKRNPSMQEAHIPTLAQTLRCLDNSLHEYFDDNNEAEIERLHSLMATQLKAAQWTQ